MNTPSPRGHHLPVALQLHAYLVREHLEDGGMVGPDAGVRWNYRVGRFVKSALPFWPWRDRYYYLQAQAYWILGNLALWRRTDRRDFLDLAVEAAERITREQQPGGYWEYPNIEWQGRVATTEGTWASMALLETCRAGGEGRFGESALAWYRYLEKEVGYQQIAGTRAVNYFAHAAEGGRVPNNSVTVLRFLGMLSAHAEVPTEDTCDGLLAFLESVQTDAGEIPYTVPGVSGDESVPHFQCFQYNAFIALNLAAYFQLRGDDRALALLRGTLRFLGGALTDTGHARYACGQHHRSVTYHTAAVGAALARGQQLGLGDFSESVRVAFSWVTQLQRRDGSFPHSRGDYLLLRDSRSYPRYLCMILYHLLVAEGDRENSTNSSVDSQAL